MLSLRMEPLIPFSSTHITISPFFHTYSTLKKKQLLRKNKNHQIHNHRRIFSSLRTLNREDYFSRGNNTLGKINQCWRTD